TKYRILGRAEDAVLGGEVSGLGHARRWSSIKRLFELMGSASRGSCGNAARFGGRCANEAAKSIDLIIKKKPKPAFCRGFFS
ncbi:hypothetical protein, partial [Xanthomonas fragariae]|uniref:hypothetical protein n=1 Tax=Xanthomonas fragariae TaxID=48664 RepID=UPI001F1D6FC8